MDRRASLETRINYMPLVFLVHHVRVYWYVRLHLIYQIELPR